MNEDVAINKRNLMLLMFDYLPEINGRTRIQKMLYLANSIWGEAIKDYLFYEYGPYSESVKRELEILVQNNFLNEEKEESDDETRTIYKYRLTEEGRKFSGDIIKLIDDSLVHKTKSLFQHLRKYSTDDLEIITSILFLHRSNPSKGNDTLVKLVKLYKPRFSEPRIRENLEKLEAMSLYLK